MCCIVARPKCCERVEVEGKTDMVDRREGIWMVVPKPNQKPHARTSPLRRYIRFQAQRGKTEYGKKKRKRDMATKRQCFEVQSWWRVFCRLIVNLWVSLSFLPA